MELEQRTGKNSYRSAVGFFCASDVFLSWLLSLAGEPCTVGAEGRQKNPTVAQ